MQTDKLTEKNSSSKKIGAGVLYLCLGAILLIGPIRLLFRSAHASSFTLGLRVFDATCGLVVLLAGLFVIFGYSSFGRVGHEQIVDLRIEQRVRERYAAEIQQLTLLGFNYVFTESESFSAFRILLIFPALMLLMMSTKREVLTLRGSKILVAMPIFSSADGRTFGHPFGLGVKFQTAFRNGRLLVSKNFGDDCRESPEFVVHAAKRTVPETWQIHQEWLNKLDVAANPVNRDSSYQAYVTISCREEDYQKSQM